jgi:hypothetical protein
MVIASPQSRGSNPVQDSGFTAREYYIEIWEEIENYAAMDAMDKWLEEDPKRAAKMRDMWKEGNEYFEWGPAKLMGDWPESSLMPD